MKIRNRIKELRNVLASTLKPNPKNWRTHPQAQSEAMRGILAEIGYADSLIARELPDGTLMLIDGHLRAETTPDEMVPVQIVDLTEAEADKLLLSLDPLAAMAESNAAAMQQLCDDAETNNAALQAMWDEMQANVEQPAVEIVEDDVPEPPVDPITKPGDLWILGEHRVLCGDSTKAEDVGRLMAGATIGSVITDPPFGMDFLSNHRAVKHKAIAGDSTADLLVYACGIEADHSSYVFCRWDNLLQVPPPTSLITWVKNNWSMGDLEHAHARQTEVALFYRGKNHSFPDGRPSDVVQHSRTGNDLHPTQKPVSLLAEIIGWSIGLIHDPFLGSGTTLIAAEQLGRKCYGMEISPAYCDVIVKRWENLTGKKATLEMTNGKTRPTKTTDSSAIAAGKSGQAKDKRSRAKA